MRLSAFISGVGCVLTLLFAVAGCSDSTEENAGTATQVEAEAENPVVKVVPLQDFLADPNAENPDRGQWRDLSREPFRPEWVGGTLTFLRSRAFSNFNPFLSSDPGVARLHVNFLTPPLVLESVGLRDGAFYFEPEAAASLPVIGEDGRKHRWTLKAGMTWEGGTRVTSNDFEFTHQMMKNKGVKCLRRADFEGIERIVAVDDLNFDVVYRTPQTLSSSRFGTSFPLLCATETPRDPEVFNKTDRLPSCGPYRIGKTSPEGLRLVLRDEYRQQAHPAFTTYVEAVEYRYVGDGPARQALIREGRCDITTVSGQRFLATHSDQSFRSKMWSSVYFLPAYDFIGWNCLDPNQLDAPHPILGDVEVRKALAYFIDKKAVIARARGGLAEPVTGPAYFKSRDYDREVAAIPFDPKAGLALLSKAGYTPNSRGFLEKDGRELKFSILVPPLQSWTDPAQLLVEGFRQYGIQATMDAPQGKGFSRKFGARQFDATLVRCSLSPIEPDYYALFHSSQAGPNKQNWSGIKDTGLDEMLAAARDELEPAKRLAKRRRVHGAVSQAHPFAFLWATPTCVAVNRRWANVKVHDRGLWFRDFVLRELMEK